MTTYTETKEISEKFYEAYSHLLYNRFISGVGCASVKSLRKFAAKSIEDIMKKQEDDAVCIFVQIDERYKRSDIPEELPDLFLNVPVVYQRETSLTLFGKHFFTRRVKG